MWADAAGARQILMEAIDRAKANADQPRTTL